MVVILGKDYMEDFIFGKCFALELMCSCGTMTILYFMVDLSGNFNFV